MYPLRIRDVHIALVSTRPALLEVYSYDGGSLSCHAASMSSSRFLWFALTTK